MKNVYINTRMTERERERRKKRNEFIRVKRTTTSKNKLNHAHYKYDLKWIVKKQNQRERMVEKSG